jgi:Holliday junction resolvase YEN1
VDIVGLREFSRETFDWDFKIGAVKFIRVLAPSLLVQQFLDRYVSLKSNHDDLDLKEKEESALVRAISSKRAHFSTDATPELRISFVPANIVKLDLDKEPEEEVEGFGRSGIALNSDDEFDEAEELDAEQPKSSSARKPFDPLEPELVLVPVTLAKLGIPLTVEDWEGRQRLK